MDDLPVNININKVSKYTITGKLHCILQLLDEYRALPFPYPAHLDHHFMPLSLAHHTDYVVKESFHRLERLNHETLVFIVGVHPPHLTDEEVYTLFCW